MAKLNKAYKEFIMQKNNLGLSNCELARQLGVSEGTIRYHRGKERNKKDGRKERYSEVSRFEPQIKQWVEYNCSSDRKNRDTVKSLYQILSDFHGFTLSYDALRRYIRKRYPQLIPKSYRIRVETPPGKMTQVDWKESVSVQIGRPNNWIKLNFLVVLLCFSRKPAVVVTTNRDKQSFLSAHHRALGKLHGVTEYMRPDCMKTAVKSWNGRESEMNSDYKEFLESVGSLPFPARPGTPTDKGKVEKKILDLFRDLKLNRRVFEDLEELQAAIDNHVEEKSREWSCPATGTTIEKAYRYEKEFLLPHKEGSTFIPVDTIVTKVLKDSTVNYKGNYYQVPEGYVGKSIRCINTGTRLELHFEGQILEAYGYCPGPKGMVRISERVVDESKRPLSDLTREWCKEVATHQLDYYQAIMGGEA